MGFFISLFSVHGMACDACGCINGPMGLGILQGSKSAFVSLRYKYTSATYKSNPNAWIFKEVDSKTDIHYTDLSLRLRPHDKILVSFSVPFVISQKVSESQVNRLAGPGDINTIVQFIAYESKAKPMKFDTHRLIIGAGLKIPSGKFNKNSNAQFIRSIQSGTGSFDFPITMNYFGNYKKWSWLAESFTKWNTTNPNGYRQGISFQNQISALYTIRLKNVSIIPALGLQHFYVRKDTDKKRTQNTTGINMMSSVIQCNLQFFSVNLNIGADIPFLQKNKSGNQNLKPSLSFQISYLI